MNEKTINFLQSHQLNNIDSREKIKTKRMPLKRFIIAAAMMLFLAVGVSAYYISTLFFAPGYGILQDADFTIYATKEKVMLGNFVVDAVTRTVDETGSIVCIWLFQTEEIESFLSEEERKIGIPPYEFTGITAVFDDGTEIKIESGGGSIPGFWQYICKNTPDTNTFRLRDVHGNEARVALEDISKTEYADLKGIKFDDISMTIVPLSGTRNVFAAEITDKFTLNISKYADNSGFHVSFFMEDSNGGIGYASGNAMLKGYKDDYKYHSVETVTKNYDMAAERLMLNYIQVMHSFNEVDDKYSVTVPNEGETINCNIPMFDAEDVKFIIKSIKNENGVLKCETETKDNVKNKHRTKAMFYFSVGIYEDYIYEEDDEIKTYNHFTPLINNNDNINNNYDIAWFNLKTHNSTIIKPGDKIFFQLNTMFYEYQWDKTSERLNSDWWKDPTHNLGVINLK